jgi:hypothetical protein
MPHEDRVMTIVEDGSTLQALIDESLNLLAALKALVEAGEFAVSAADDLAIMLRLGQATDMARAAIAKADGR